ncbi:MAG: stress-induced protein [Alphaproteobacteria bacterium]|nr:stress-induced protein [Alphaproteobacteria bacterium]
MNRSKNKARPASSGRGFAAMPTEKVQEIARKGGHASAEKAGHEGMSARGHKGGETRAQQLGHEGYVDLGQKGGSAPHRGRSK